MLTLNHCLYVSVYSSFKFKYIFNIISTYIVNVESTLNQQTRACWDMVGQIYTTELQLNKENSSDKEAPFLDMDLCITNGIV